MVAKPLPGLTIRKNMIMYANRMGRNTSIVYRISHISHISHTSARTLTYLYHRGYDLKEHRHVESAPGVPLER